MKVLKSFGALGWGGDSERFFASYGFRGLGV